MSRRGNQAASRKVPIDDSPQMVFVGKGYSLPAGTTTQNRRELVMLRGVTDEMWIVIAFVTPSDDSAGHSMVKILPSRPQSTESVTESKFFVFCRRRHRVISEPM